MMASKVPSILLCLGFSPATGLKELKKLSLSQADRRNAAADVGNTAPDRVPRSNSMQRLACTERRVAIISSQPALYSEHITSNLRGVLNDASRCPHITHTF